MYLLYLDASGSVKNPNERHFVLAGVAVFERQVYHLISHADRFVESLDLGDPHEIELHGSVMAYGKCSPWKGKKDTRLNAIKGGLNLLANAHDSVTAFAVVVDKQAIPHKDPVEHAFEEICNRFNLFLNRMYYRQSEQQQRGLIIMDKSNYEGALQNLARDFREHGTRWDALRNLAEVPLFVDSAASRLIQIADLLSWAVWQRYEKNDTSYFDIIVDRFDKKGGVIHGLVHHRSSATPKCHCPACMSRSINSPKGKR